MSRQCAICGKKPLMAGVLKKLIGKYNPTIKKRRSPNLQWARLASGVKPRRGHAPLRGKRVKACVRCIRTLAKHKP